ncbi:MAG: hypothetical protein ISR96_11435 [Nitrospira sp.]|nr:hypothetical protein [bacterium]MBL7050117.1 hypothetical protein [Nitrospira sp.]
MSNKIDTILPAKFTKIIETGFFPKLVVAILLIFIAGSALSGVILYNLVDTSLDTHYSAVISILTDARETLVINTIKINAVFAIFIIAGTISIGILYTHRIAGPLYRVKLFARDITAGKLASVVSFRKKDTLHAFGDTLNVMAESYRDRLISLSSDLHSLNASVSELNAAAGERSAIEPLLKSIRETDEKITAQLESVVYEK